MSSYVGALWSGAESTLLTSPSENALKSEESISYFSRTLASAKDSYESSADASSSDYAVAPKNDFFFFFANDLYLKIYITFIIFISYWLILN